jgi:hypothetical protein
MRVLFLRLRQARLSSWGSGREIEHYGENAAALVGIADRRFAVVGSTGLVKIHIQEIFQ